MVRKSKNPRAFRGIDIEQSLPVVYYNSKKAWFNQAIFTDLFLSHFVPEVRKYQEEVLKIAPDDVRAVLVLDNTPAHPSEEKLVSRNGKIKVLYLPPKTTSIIQLMDQGIICAMKRHYVRHYLNEVFTVIEDDKTEVDIRGECTLANIKYYNIRSVIYNFAAAWQDLKVPVLSNSWKRLIADEDTEVIFEGCQAEDFLGLLRRGGEVSTSIDDITDWLDELDLDPGYEVLSEADIVASVVVSEEEESSDEEETMKVPKVKLSTLWTYIDALIDYSSYSQLPEMAHHYENLRMIRELIIKKQHMGGSQTKISSFFGLCHPIQDGAPASLSPHPMGTPPVSEDRTNVYPCCSHSPITSGDDVQDADRAEVMIISDSD